MHADIKSVLYAGSRDELNAKLFERDKRIAELEAALTDVLVGGNHVALLIGADHPAYQWDHAEARQHYGSNQDAYEAWCCWRTIMQARDVLENTNTK